MKKLLVSFAAIAALISCVKETHIAQETPNVDEIPVVEETVVTLAAVGPRVEDPNSTAQQQNAPSTRTQLVDGKIVHWTPGDKIKMCFDVQPNFLNKKYGPTAEFESQSQSASKKTAFTGSIDMSNAGSYGFVAYPTSISFTSSGEDWNDFMTEVSYDLQAAQTAVDNTFAPDLNLSWASVTKTQVNNNASSKTPIDVTFKNMCALIKVVLPAQDYKITEINIASELNGLTGDRSLTWEATSSKQELKLGNFKSAVNEVTMAKEDGSVLTLGASYFAVVWPGSHSGLTFKFTDAEGRTCTKKLSADINCEAGKVTTINIKSALEFKEADPELTTNNSSLNFAAAGGESSFSFNTNKKWTITDIPDWLTLDQTLGEPSKDAISVNVKCYENTQYQPRTGTITISAGGLTKTITVTQEAAVKVVSLSVSTISLSVAGQGGTASFTVTCNDNWTITDIPDYVTVSQTSGTESASAVTVTVTAKQNFFYNSRNKSFTIKAGDQVKYISVNQNGVTSYSIGSQVSKAGDLQDGQPYIIENNKYAGLYWKWQSSNLKYCKWNSAGVQTIMCTFIYHRDDSKGKSGDSNYKSWSTGIWEAAASSGQYLNSNWKFASISEAKYIANSNCWGTETGKEFDMCEVGKTTSVCYTNTSTENGGSYYWGSTSETNRKWKVYNAVPQY